MLFFEGYLFLIVVSYCYGGEIKSTQLEYDNIFDFERDFNLYPLNTKNLITQLTIWFALNAVCYQPEGIIKKQYLGSEIGCKKIHQFYHI